MEQESAPLAGILEQRAAKFRSTTPNAIKPDDPWDIQDERRKNFLRFAAEACRDCPSTSNCPLVVLAKNMLDARSYAFAKELSETLQLAGCQTDGVVSNPDAFPEIYPLERFFGIKIWRGYSSQDRELARKLGYVSKPDRRIN